MSCGRCGGYSEQNKSAYVFTSERGAPFGTAGFARMVESTGIEAAARS